MESSTIHTCIHTPGMQFVPLVPHGTLSDTDFFGGGRDGADTVLSHRRAREKFCGSAIHGMYYHQLPEDAQTTRRTR